MRAPAPRRPADRRRFAARAAAVSAWLSLAACPLPARDLGGDQAPQTEYGSLEWELFQRVSLHRDSLGLPRLRFDQGLADIARAHSLNMAFGAVPFSHQNFEQRVDLAARLGFWSLGENVAYNDYPADTTAVVAVAGLIASPPHRHTMEGTWVRSGVGVARSAGGSWYYTQLFAR
jgi:uncharacterized protein YkwD